ncbi:MAG: hypothetical protein AB7O93_26895 [Vicinamibacterales bacterium]
MGIPTAVTAALLVVRIYHGVETVGADVHAALAEALAIMSRAAIAVSWIDCAPARRGAAVDARCAFPLAPHEVVLRILAKGPLVKGLLVPMGYTPVASEVARTPRASSTTVPASTPDGAPGAPTSQVPPVRPTLATVYADRVARVARDAGVDYRMVLGRAVAHELGHLLLNHTGHADHGVMKGTWSRDQLRRTQQAAWTFVERDAAAMRAALAARAADGRS